MALIAIGTSSWLFGGWRGVFYPQAMPRRDYLAYYTTQFPTVEVNTSFYAIPAPDTLIDWVEIVPEGFTFALKFPRAISHDKRLADVTTESLAFLDAVRSLGPAAAPAFLQLPPNLTRSSHGKQLALYLDWLAVHSKGLRIAVEVRAADLMTSAFAAYLAERNFALVLADRQGQPDLYAIWLALVQEHKTPPFAFVRWIGDDRNGPKGDHAIQTPRDADLSAWAERLATLAAHGVDVFGYVHNPYEGHSPATVRRLQTLLAGHTPLPAWPPPTGEGDAGQLSLL